MQPIIEKIYGILGDVIYGVDVKSLEEVVNKLLLEKKMTISTAESCTGGFISKRITDLRGASKVFMGTAVTYSPESKISVLGVHPETIENYGVVSAEVASEMARNVRRIFNTGIAISTTGLSGPEGDGKNPVGTVFIALATEEHVFIQKINSGFGRSRSRTMATNLALDMARRYLSGLPVVLNYGDRE